MSEQPVYVAVRARRYHDKRGDGLEVYLRNGPDDAWVRVGDAADDFTAPWLSREEQDEQVRALEGLMEVAEMAMPDTYFQTDSRVNRARDCLALLQSRLYPTTGDRG